MYIYKFTNFPVNAIVIVRLPHPRIYIYIYICNHEKNVPSRLSPQWLCGNSCTWAHDVRFCEI